MTGTKAMAASSDLLSKPTNRERLLHLCERAAMDMANRMEARIFCEDFEKTRINFMFWWTAIPKSKKIGWGPVARPTKTKPEPIT